MEHATRPQLEALATIGILTTGTFRARLEHFVRTFYTFVVLDERSKKIFRLLFLEGRRDCGMADQFHETSLTPFDEIIQRLLEDGAKAGEFRSVSGPDAKGVVLGPAVNAMMSSMLFSPGRLPDIERHIQTHIDILFNGLLVR